MQRCTHRQTDVHNQTWKGIRAYILENPIFTMSSNPCFALLSTSTKVIKAPLSFGTRGGKKFGRTLAPSKKPDTVLFWGAIMSWKIGVLLLNLAD